MQDEIPEKGAAEIAKRVLKKNLLNIIEKVQAGKTLSPAELLQIQSFTDGEVGGTKTYAKNQVELAEIMQVDRKTVQRWLKVKGCPAARPDGRYSVLEWKTWAESTGRKVADSDDFESERGRLEVRRLRTICERLDLELETTKGNYTHNDEIKRRVYRMVGSSRKILGAIPAQAAPQVVGMTIPEAEAFLKEQIDDAMRRLHEDEWQE